MKKSSVFDQRTSALKKIVKGRKVETQSSAATVESTPTASSQRASLESQLDAAQTKLRELSHEIAQLQTAVDNQHRQADQAKQAAQTAQAEQQRIEEQKVQTQQDLQSATIENINKLSQKISNKQNDILIDRQRIDELKDAKDTSKRSAEDEAQIKRLNEQRKALEETQAEVQKNVDGANQIVQREIQEVEKAKVAISDAADQDVQQAREKLQMRQIDLNTARYNLRGAERKLADVKENLTEVKNQTSLLQGDATATLQATKEKLANDEQLLVDYQNRLAVLQNANNRMQSLRTELRRAEEAVQRETRKREIIQQDLAEKINQLTVAKRKGLDCQQEIEELQHELRTVSQPEIQKPAVPNQRLPQVGENTCHHGTPKRTSLLKVAALTVSEILTRLDFGHHKKPQK